MANILLKLTLITSVFTLTACPIVRGTGHVVEETGEGVAHAVEGTGHAIGQTGRELAGP